MQHYLSQPKMKTAKISNSERLYTQKWLICWLEIRVMGDEEALLWSLIISVVPFWLVCPSNYLKLPPQPLGYHLPSSCGGYVSSVVGQVLKRQSLSQRQVHMVEWRMFPENRSEGSRMGRGKKLSNDMVSMLACFSQIPRVALEQEMYHKVGPHPKCGGHSPIPPGQSIMGWRMGGWRPVGVTAVPPGVILQRTVSYHWPTLTTNL